MFELLTGHGVDNLRSSDAFIYLFKGYTIVGTNPPMDAGPLYYIWSAFLNTNAVIFSPFLCGVGYILKYMQHTIETKQLLIGIQASLNVLGIPPKIIIMTLSLKRLRSMESTLALMDARYTKPEDLNLIRKSAIMGNRLVFAFGMAYFSYWLLTGASCLINGKAPLSLWIPFLDENRSNFDFCFQSTIDLFFMFFFLLYQVLNDSYGSVYICVIRAHLQLLVRRVQLLGRNVEMSSDDKIKELVDCIITHQQILRLLGVIEPIISKTMFTQFLIAASILCVTMINMFISDDLSTQVASGAYFMCVLLQISPCCYFASELMADSEKLPDAIFHCNWVEQDRCFRKMIIYFMHRSQLSIQLTAMKLFSINVATNVSIAKFSFTLFTFVKEMGIGQNAKK
uniref:Odorant receptor n=1 Tax=Anastrepha ludens TaxID=28586 RepID=A0A9E8DA97_9MUSC|nr:odorant receptor 7a8 [Anastrepha ludens]